MRNKVIVRMRCVGIDLNMGPRLEIACPVRRSKCNVPLAYSTVRLYSS